MKVIFFNHFHNGDVHLSREFVHQIINKLPNVSFEYSHRNPANLLADIPRLVYNSNAIRAVPNEHIGIHCVNDTIYFNTWYGQKQFKHMNAFGLTFDTIYAAFDENCREAFSFSLNDVSQEPTIFYPTIDYSKFEITHAQNWIIANPGKKILIENGPSLSGQSDNFSMTTAIANVAQKHMDKIFILSNQDNIALPNNCIYSSNIIKKDQRSDLNEISFLSTHCDLIIGIASGVFAFTMTQQNFFHRQPKFLCFYNLSAQNQEYWLGPMFRDKIKYSATFFTYNEYKIDRVQNIIQTHL